ncbi:MAG: HD domain-containing protein [Phycisphaerae bacterium]
MARRFIKDIGPGERFESVTFLVASKDLRTTTQGSLYIHCVLADRTGRMTARVWSASEAMYRAMTEGGFINVKGRSENYKGALQFIIEAIRPVDTDSIELGDFLPRTERDIDEMWSRTGAILEEIKDPAVGALIGEFLKDEVLIARFKVAPAAVSLHHAYIGGLLEHTLNVLELARLAIPRYPKVQMDLVVAGLFLHDLGKTAELSFDTSFRYTDQGQMLGHISICSQWIDRMAERAAQTTGKPFPDRVKWALQHIVISHHARPEFGSPKVPATPEALAVHYLDNLDAKLNMSIAAIEADTDERDWTPFNRALETKLFKRNPLAGETHVSESVG